MKILITGITGFVGSHLAEYCLRIPKVKLFGTMRSHHLGDELQRIKHIEGKITLFECDLRNRIAVSRVLERLKPDKIFHLAAQSFVPTSWDSPEDTLFTNIMAELNIFEVLKENHNNPVILIAGSSEEYGLVFPSELPITENNPLRPLSPYAVSKITQEMLAFQYHHSYKLKTIITRAFNHTGPRRGDQFVTSNFAKQVAQIERGLQKPTMFVGNLEAQRDFTDVRDMVHAYYLASEKCEFAKPYVVCSGRARTIRSVLDLLLSLSTVKNIKVKQDKKRMRPSDVPCLVGDCSKFKNQTGWEPRIPFEKTMEDLLKYWRERI